MFYFCNLAICIFYAFRVDAQSSGATQCVNFTYW